MSQKSLSLGSTEQGLKAETDETGSGGREVTSARSLC